MVFVNKIAEIVHRNVEEWGGSPNKNVGEAFLLVWKLNPPENEQELTEQFINSSLVQQTADLALYSFIKIIAQINSSDQLARYLQQRRLYDLIDGFKLSMGFGLHFGWAIEGAIGSYFKIDTSYLSPNVNMASRL